MAAMDRATAELFLASLFVETTPERQEALRNAAKAVRNWDGLKESLEGHGLIGLFRANCAAAGLELPATVATAFEARAGHQRGADQRARLGLQRYLAAAGRERVEVTLVGSSALCFDLYDAPLRRLGELELHVAPEHLARALRAGEQAGFLLAEESLPAWWYARTMLDLPLAPASSYLQPLRLRARLHHPSLLLTSREPEILARRRLVTGRRHLLDAAGRGTHALRLDLLLDLRTFIEKHHARLRVTEVLSRAGEWSAEPALRAALECLQMGLGFLPEARDWARQVAQGVAAAAPPGAIGAAPAQFRPDPIERLPQWLRPSDPFLVRRHALPAGAPVRALRLARARHVAGVLGGCALAGAAFPLALLGRRLQRDLRRKQWEFAQSPQQMGDVSEAWRTAASRAEQQKPLAPKTIALDPESSVARYPDRYRG
jgi:hypothetical protein